MCRASTEPGGAKRCASHAKSKHDQTLLALEALQSAYTTQSQLREFARETEASSGLFAARRNKRRLAALMTRLPLSASEQRRVQEAFEDAEKKRWQERKASQQAIYYSRSRDEEESRMASHAEVCDQPLFTEAFESRLADSLLDPTLTDRFFTARRAEEDARRQYFGTVQGLASQVFDDSKYDENGNPDAELKEVVRLFSRESASREVTRRHDMERVRLHAKATTKAEDWAEYDRWQTAWNNDPTLLNPSDTYTLQSRIGDIAVLGAFRNSEGRGVPGWHLILTRDPNTGSVSSKVRWNR